MARSHSIYILVDTGSGETIGCFTVKHEMQTARDKHPKRSHCWRYRDNDPYGDYSEVEEVK
jgi:hypothetical protein